MRIVQRLGLPATRRLSPVLLAVLLLGGRAAPAQGQAAKPQTPVATEVSAEQPLPLFHSPSAESDVSAVVDGAPHESSSRFSDEVIGLQPVPERPPLLLEMHDDFLGSGFLSPGIELPTGAVWRPSLWVFGTNRTAVQYFQDHQTTNTAEVVDRLDLFAQLNLTGTERIVFGVRPLDHEIDNFRTYTSYNLTRNRYVDGLNFYPQTLFFEGDFGEIFPHLDLYDTKALDYGFSIGRQPAFYQGGMLINADILDAVTVTRNTLSGHDVLNSRITFMYAWDRVHRNDDTGIYDVDTKAQLFGLFTETDFKVSTVDIDIVYVNTPDPATRDGIYFGASATQRLQWGSGTYNSTARVLGSFPVDGETLATGKGVLLFNELSLTPRGSENLVYCTTFAAIGRFTSAARGVEMAGPLSPEAGILFSRPQIGVFGTALNSLTNDVVGGAVGYQILSDHLCKNLTIEVGGRQDTDGSHTAAIGFGVLYQQALGQHSVFILNPAISKQEGFEPAVGLRAELLVKF